MEPSNEYALLIFLIKVSILNDVTSVSDNDAGNPIPTQDQPIPIMQHSGNDTKVNWIAI